MRPWSRVIVASAVFLAAACAGVDRAVAANCVDPAPCVYVSPDPAKVKRPGTIYVYRGRGWRPNRTVAAGYGSYCPPSASACAGVGLSSSFKADRRGRFTFRLRHGNRLPADVPRPAGAGGEADTIEFSQWTGRPFRSRSISRDATPVPPPSTPAQRVEARAVAASFARTARALDAAERPVNRSMDRYQQGLRQCRDQLQGTADGRVVASLIGLAFDGALYAPVKPQLDALAGELERLALADPVLRAGADAWIAAVRRPRPWPDPDLCTVMQRWSETGFDLAQAPVPPDAGDRLELLTEIATTPAIADAAARLRALGAGRVAEASFAGDLLDVADLIGES
ncbi:hypothetical protein OJ998_23825 [Solirubrobacter taibaiensis]|nr:hypothetical protein [Solirubrobacter taibaiensis]